MKILMTILIILILTACSDYRESWLYEQEEIFTVLYHEAFPDEKVIQDW